jgi:hypothetical protein
LLNLPIVYLDSLCTIDMKPVSSHSSSLSRLHYDFLWGIGGLFLVGSGWGSALNLFQVHTVGVISLLLAQYPITSLCFCAFFVGVGVIGGGCIPTLKTALLFPLRVSYQSGGILLAVGLAGVAIRSLLSLAVYSFGSLALAIMGGSNPQPLSLSFHLYAWEVLAFCAELSAWLAALVLLGALMGVVFRLSLAQGSSISLTLLTLVLTLGGGFSLGSWQIHQCLLWVGLALAIAVPFWVFDQVKQRGKSQGLAAMGFGLTAIIITTLGLSLIVGWSMVWLQGLIALTVVFCLFPPLIIFEQSLQRGWGTGVALLLCALAALFPGTGLGLGVAYQNRPLGNDIERVSQNP